MIALQVPRLGTALLAVFGVLLVFLGYWQVLAAAELDQRADNPQVIAVHFGAPRGTIFDARGVPLATTTIVDGIARRAYADPAFAHVIGYASLRYGQTGLERVWDPILTGLRDPNPVSGIVDDILNRQPEPHDLVLTIDQRLQAFAASQLEGKVGAIVAIDPLTGAVLAMTSSPAFDATAFSGVPSSGESAWMAVQADPDHPLIDRARNGVYTPGSIMKVVTAALALEAGAITPQTTFADQPEEERIGFVVNGFTIKEHRLGRLEPELWDLSPALQVSSNIYFAHVGLELGGQRLLDGARAFGFCAPLAVGSDGRDLPGVASFLTVLDAGGCAPFVDETEVAVAAFGQGRVTVTPLQMALVAATIANDGRRPDPFVVREVRVHAVDGGLGPLVQAYSGGSGRTVVSPATAAAVRAAMVDAVNGLIGRTYAGGGDVSLYGISGVLSAGKTGTAERGGDLRPHAWFIGFVPAQSGAQPAIAVAVIVEGGGAASDAAAPLGGRVMAEWLRLLGAD